MSHDANTDGGAAGGDGPCPDSLPVPQTDRPDTPVPPGLVARLHAEAAEGVPAGPTAPTALISADPEAARLWDLLDEVRRRLRHLHGSHADDRGAFRTSGPDCETPVTPGAASGGSAGIMRDRPPSSEPMPDSEPMPEFVAARVRRALIAQQPLTEVPEPDGGSASPRPARLRRLLIGAAAVIAIGSGAAAPALWELAHAAHSAPQAIARSDAALDDGGAGRDVPADAGRADRDAGSEGAGRAGTAAPPPGAPSAASSSRPDAHGEGPSASVASPTGGASRIPQTPLDALDLLREEAAQDPGPFADGAALRRCLRVNGLPAGSRLLGSGPVHVDGRTGTLLLVPGPRPPELTALVVTDRCGSGGDGLLYRTDIGAP